MKKAVGIDIAFVLTILYVCQQLMKRKLFISTLLGIFLFSTTGLPLTLHICSVNGLSSSATCKMHKVVKEEHSCCSKEEEAPVKITVNDFNGCCEFKVIEGNPADQYTAAGSDLNVKSGIKSLHTGIISFYQSPVFSNSFIFNSSTSPPLTGNHLYLNISVLLI